MGWRCGSFAFAVAIACGPNLADTDSMSSSAEGSGEEGSDHAADCGSDSMPAFAGSPSTGALRQWGTAADDGASGVAVDPTGSLVVVGHSGELSSQAPFLTKFDVEGNEIWTQTWGTAGSTRVWAVAVAADGSIYVAGSTDDDLDGSGGVGGDDLYVRRFAADGSTTWTRQWGSSENERASGVALGIDGEIYVAGMTLGELTSSAGFQDVFATRLSSSGAVEWTTQWGTADGDYGEAIAVDCAGDVIVVGQSSGAIAGDENRGKSDAFASKLDREGMPIWTTTWGSAREDSADAVMAATDAIYVVGSVTLYDDGGFVESDGVVVRLGHDGELQWQEAWDGDERDLATAVAPVQGGVLVGGVRGHDAAVARFDGEGASSWTKVWASDADDVVHGLAVGPSHVFAVGHTDGILATNSSGGEDAFVVRLDP